MKERAAQLFSHQSVRYLFSGGCAFVAEYGTFFVLYSVAHVELYVANSVSFCTGLLVSFMFNRLWAFKQATFNIRRHHQMALYALLAGCNLLATNVLIGLLRQAHITPLFAKIGIMACVACWNFFIFRRFIFAPAKAS